MDFKTEEEVTQNPVVISTNLPKVVQIASGAQHLVMLCENGNVFTLGHGIAGQLGRKLPNKFRGDLTSKRLDSGQITFMK